MAGVSPSPATYTLFLKNAKTTTLAYVLPSTPLHSLKAELVRLLYENSRNLTIELPDDADDIILGALIDPEGVEISRGFHVIAGQDRKKTTIKDAGIKDGAVLAWRLQGDQKFVVDVPVDEDQGEDDMEE